MRKSVAKFLFSAVCAMFFAQDILAATTWKITMWNYSKNKDRTKAFTYALSNAIDGDILELQNNISVTSDAEVYDKVLVTSKSGSKYTIKNIGRTYICNVHPGGTLTISNVTFDCENALRREDLFKLHEMEVSSRAVTNIARMVLGGGATIKNVYLTSSSGNENAAIHIKKGAILRIQPGAMIQNCKNESNPGKGGAICCDYGTIIMTGGTITGCSAVGDGGAIHTDGTRVDAVDVEGISARGDIYISGGYITNNVCGAGKYGGAIYLGNSGPMLHITGSPVITNNFSGSALGRGTPDDVSTYLLENAYANRLKLTGHSEVNPSGFTTNGIMFTGKVGVRYPDPEKDKISNPQGTRFGGLWEYFTGTQDELRNFFWNGDPAYHGNLLGNSLVWANFIVHELPRDNEKVAELVAQGTSPIYIQLNDDYEMTQVANLPKDMEIVIDLNGFNLKCDFHVSNETSRVVIRDTSLMKSGTVSGHRESEYPGAFLLEGGSYHTLPPDEWVASNRVLIANYCTEHPYMVASLAWDTTNTVRMADLTKVPLSHVDDEVRIVTQTSDIENITFSTGDWVHMLANENKNLRAQVFAVAAVSNETTGVVSEAGEKVVIFDTLDPHGGVTGREDEFVWNAMSYGLIKLMHVTMELVGEKYVTNNVESAYFKFPNASFVATQRKDDSKKPITIVDELLRNLGYDRAQGFAESTVNDDLDVQEANGLKKWENIVTGTEQDQLLLSTVAQGENAQVLNVQLADAGKVARPDTGYEVKYALCKSSKGSWEQIGEVASSPNFSIELLDEFGKSVGASGFYRISTLIIPNSDLAVTNEIASKNIVGVLEVASLLTNTLAAVPWTALPSGKDHLDEPVALADFVNTTHLDDEDALQVADKGHIYRKWHWDKGGKKWQGAITVTRDGMVPAASAREHHLPRNSSVWVTRNDPAAKPFFLIGQYSDKAIDINIAAGSVDEPVCTLVPNPSMKAMGVNDYYWGTNPVKGPKGDVIRIPNEKSVPLNLTWDGEKWGRYVKVPGSRESRWKTDDTIPAGTGFWYMRNAGGYLLTLPSAEIE